MEIEKNRQKISSENQLGFFFTSSLRIVIHEVAENRDLLAESSFCLVQL